VEVGQRTSHSPPRALESSNEMVQSFSEFRTQPAPASKEPSSARAVVASNAGAAIRMSLRANGLLRDRGQPPLPR
jgi:hypothetical protein